MMMVKSLKQVTSRSSSNQTHRERQTERQTDRDTERDREARRLDLGVLPDDDGEVLGAGD
jgi:hypothetical protein